jgi:hypothetical protein
MKPHTSSQRHIDTEADGEKSGVGVTRGGFVWLIWVVSVVWFISFLSAIEPNEPNKPKKLNEPDEPDEQKRRKTTGEAKIGYLATRWLVDLMAARIFTRDSTSNSCP